jgi:hypothetical protein
MGNEYLAEHRQENQVFIVGLWYTGFQGAIVEVFVYFSYVHPSEQRFVNTSAG